MCVLFGVVGVIYEVCFNVIVDIVVLVLCLGNVVVLCGGSVVCDLNMVLVEIMCDVFFVVGVMLEVI